MNKKTIISFACIFVFAAACCGCEGSKSKDLTEISMQQFQNENYERAIKVPNVSANEEGETKQSENMSETAYLESEFSDEDNTVKETQAETETADYQGILQTEENFDPFLASIDLPTDLQWIKMKSNDVDETSLKIEYQDLIADADCTLIGVRDGELALPDIDYGNATIKTRENFHSAIEGKKDNAITLKQSENKKDVLVTWEYDNYKFAIIGKLNGQNTKASSIADTAAYIIEAYMTSTKLDKNAGVETSGNAAEVYADTDIKYQESQLNLGNTIDVPADIDNEYRESQPYPQEIEELQAAISKGMSDKELPFVTSSGIYENPLRVEVVVNTNDEALINKVRSYDKTGTLLKIAYSQGATTAVLE